MPDVPSATVKIISDALAWLMTAGTLPTLALVTTFRLVPDTVTRSTLSLLDEMDVTVTGGNTVKLLVLVSR